MITRELQDHLSILMIRASIRGKDGTLALADAHGITLMQALTLCLLKPNEPIQMNVLSGSLSCDPSSLTGIVERLVAEGLVHRKECPDDRRRKSITLTPKGQGLRSSLLKIATEKRLPKLAALSEQELATLIRLLEKATDLGPVS